MSNTFSTNPFLEASDAPIEVRDAEAHASSGARERSSSSLSYTALERAITPRDLSVVFQPIVHASNLDVFAYEALVRCAAPAYRNPTHLFDYAVRERCAGRLGQLIRSVAIPLCTGVPVFFNVHPVELGDRWLVRPDDPIYSHDEPIFLEITETVPLEHFSLCRSVLKEIRARADARLVVDDLGAGFSNLKYIADLEPAVVKLDRELIAHIDRQPRVQRLVSWLVRLCEDLGADVVAEGVETAEELACVRDQGVHFIQGYFIARPGYPLPLFDKLARDARGRPVVGPPRRASLRPSTIPRR